MSRFTSHNLLAVCFAHIAIFSFFTTANAADCKIAIVGSPFSTCFDIYTAAKITAAQFASFNPGLNCSLLQLGQKVCISSGTLPSNAPGPSPNGTCAEYVVAPGDSCSAIAVKYDITVAKIEQWNAHTYKWTGCAGLQIGFIMCISTGNPPPIPVNPNLQCGPESPGNATCPLKACCSAFGFCGLTDAFCHTTAPNPCISNCFNPVLPSCSTSRTMKNIGYYAGWANRRPCGAVGPGQTDWSKYTHAHFAFAVISQSNEIQLASSDVGLLQDLVSQKASNPNLKVLIAVGGWDFSEADPTRDLFSITIGSSATRSKFISSVKTFLSTYQLDGIDIDFEYPGAFERGAPATDTPNLTALFRELRAALPSAIISCATPAGYWFLRGFEIDKIAPSVDYINMMSYDYHGPWDTNITDQAPVGSPHTSLEDMKASALLYVRAGIDLSKVNLGLAWYGRTYHLSDSSCSGYNCTMIGGGTPGECSRASGYLAQFEIDDIMSSGIKPTLDKISQTYWFDYAGDLITFDQDDTRIAKQAFAASTCFGGSFVWSLDQVLGSGSGGGGGPSDGQPSIFSPIPWNPNPFPSPAAPSETFIGDGTTLVVPKPTTTTFITVGGAIITLDSGGTPVNALLPTTVSEPNAITPTWSFNIIPPTAAPRITFTAPISGSATFSTVVPSPSSGVEIITGPGGVVWTLTAGPSGPSVVGTLPSTVGISGGITPSATPPDGWLGPWTDPVFPHTVKTMQPVQSNTEVPWNPNPRPPSNAPSETFDCSGTTTTLAIPTATTTITLGGATIVLNSGGTPVNGPLSTQCTEIGGIVPIWSQDIIPPPGAATITFTGPLTSTPTWVTTVPVPPRSDSPEITVIGPPGDKNRCNLFNFWSLLFGGILRDCLPLDVGIIGGITPVPIKPPGWTGPWTNPNPRPTPPPPGSDDDSNSETSTSMSTSSSSNGACPPRPTTYTLPGDDDWELNGGDPDKHSLKLRRNISMVNAINNRALHVNDDITVVNDTPHSESKPANSSSRVLVPRARPRRIAVNRCGLEAFSPGVVSLREGPYYLLDDRISGFWHTQLIVELVGGMPDTGPTEQEHVFELGYIDDFFTANPMLQVDCNWIRDNIFEYNRTDGTKMGSALVGAIDQTNNMVWVDKPMNQAKSNVVNDNTNTPDNPPMRETMDFLKAVGEFPTDGDDFDGDAEDIYLIETFLRNLAALGQYFSGTASKFRDTAIRVQNHLSEITPSEVIVPDASLPLIFYTWLGRVLSGYPNGCISRGQNAWAYYRNVMNIISAREGRAVPACFELYIRNIYQPSGFIYQNLLPPPPQSPQCNVPGTEGTMTYVELAPAGTVPAIGILPYGTNGAVRIMGSGNTNTYAVGSGATLRESHVQGRALSGATYTGCDGSFLMDDVARDTAGYATANLAFTCNGFGPQNVNINFIVSGRTLPNCILIRANGNSDWKALCGPSDASVNACAGSFLLLGGLTRRTEAMKARQLSALSKKIRSIGFSGPGGF